MASSKMAGHHRLSASTETVHTGFWDNSLAPVLTIASGDIVTLDTWALMDNRLTPDISWEQFMELRRGYQEKGVSVHSLTGPIRVDGAKRGDVLEVRILKLEVYPNASSHILPGSVGAGTLPEDFPAGRRWGFKWQEGDTTLPFAADVRVPLRPFLGVMGVAPPAAGRFSTSSPDVWGGNMDNKELVEGSTVYLPVFVDGALFSAGDGHAAQGDGEVSVSAAEAAMKEVQLQFFVRKDLVLDRPMAETPSHWITMGFDKDLNEAAKIALRDAIAWLVKLKGLSREEAYQLASLAVDLRVTQLVDGNKGIHAMIPKSMFVS